MVKHVQIANLVCSFPIPSDGVSSSVFGSQRKLDNSLLLLMALHFNIDNSIHSPDHYFALESPMVIS